MTFTSRLISSCLTCAAVTLMVAGLAAFMLTQLSGEDRRAALAQYTAERAEAQYGRFDALIASHRAGANQFARLYDALPQEQVDSLFDQYFPMHHSGVRRGRTEDFEGQISADGALTYGMAAFLGGSDHGAVERRTSVAAYLTVRAAGPAIRAQFDNLYFNDDHRLVIFAPDRADRLMFYREEAPASFRFAEHDFVRIVQPDANPLGRTVCTSLTDLLYAQDQRALTIGCHTPVRLNGRHVGAFGTTLPVADFLRHAVEDPSHREALVITRAGRIVAHPALFRSSVITDEDVMQVSNGLQLDSLITAITANGRNRGVIDDPARSGGLAAFAKMEAPGWYLIVREPAPGAPWRMWMLAALIGLGAGTLVLFQLLVLPAQRDRPAPAAA